MSDHPRATELRALAQSAVAGAVDEPLLEHVCSCDECFASYEIEWRRVARRLPGLAGAYLDAETAERIELRVARRLHSAQVGTAGTWLVTEGLLRVTIALLQPLVELAASPAETRKDDRSW